jgi:hypothetical protein
MAGDKVEAAGGQQRLAGPLAVVGNHAPRAHAAGAAAVAAEAGAVAAPAVASAVVASAAVVEVSAAVEDEDSLARPAKEY